MAEKCGTTTENGEAVASAEKLGLSPVLILVSCCSSEDSGAQIGVNKEAPLYYRLRLDRLRAVDGAESSGRAESAERVTWRGLGFCGGVGGYGN
jgi:hypothetical protein